MEQIKIGQSLVVTLKIVGYTINISLYLLGMEVMHII